ncbi:hypothetical protein L7F22_015550 [Adiantum nelumboides]|nr:hypothetical protein [Adiantum nelumboides]
MSQILGSLFGEKEARILVLGLDNAGKTTILYRLQVGEVVSTIPTIGFNVETVQYNNIKFQVWDLGGQTSIRPYWRCYFPNTQAVIYVVDSSDSERLSTAKDEFHAILEWENSLPEGERAPNFLQKERFLAGLTPILREKVKCKFPESFKEALTWARLKDRKLQFQRSWRDHSQATSRVTTQEQAHPSSPNGSGDPHLDQLRRVTKQLGSLSINLIHGLQPKQPVHQQAGGQGTNDEVPRGPPRREYQCHNYGEDEHGMYFCPYPRGYGNALPRGPQQQVSPLRMRRPPMPMCEQQQQPQQHQTIQILRQSTYAPVPQPATEVPPLPHDGVEQAMNDGWYKEEGSSSQDRQSIPTVHEVGEGSSQAEEVFLMQLVTDVTLFKQLMENPRFMEFLHSPLLAQQIQEYPPFSQHVEAQFQEEELKDAVVLVYANKQDLPGALDDAVITEGLSLHKLRSRQWAIFKTSAIKGEGIYEGLDWLSNMLKGRGR